MAQSLESRSQSWFYVQSCPTHVHEERKLDGLVRVKSAEHTGGRYFRFRSRQ